MTPMRDRRFVISDLPAVRGKYVENADMSAITWFRVGGKADILYTPKDEEDLIQFLRSLDPGVPVYTVGVGSNLLVRDGGIRGVVIRLGAAFAGISVDGEIVQAGAATLDASVAKAAGKHGLSGLEFFRGIPGTIGGALQMNAGAYGSETKDVLIDCIAIDRGGNRHVIAAENMGFSYRKCDLPQDYIFISSRFRTAPDDPAQIEKRMLEIMAAREASQPIKSRTGGSTFANPDLALSGGRKSWQLIDSVGGRGRVVGDAQVSEQHCNFMINRGSATASDLEMLVLGLQQDVLDETGVKLRLEIKLVGEPLQG